MKNQITIGRDPQSDIVVPSQYSTVSNNHADFTLRNGVLYIQDHSSNGTMINGNYIRHTTVQLKNGDTISLAGDYYVQWSQLLSYFPKMGKGTVIKEYTTTTPKQGRLTEDISKKGNIPHGNNLCPPQPHHQPQLPYIQEQKEFTSSSNVSEKYLNQFNWGAFWFSWLWAVCHRIYWPLWTLAITLVPYVGMLGVLFIQIYLGINGSKMAWKAGKYPEFGRFVDIQQKWATAALIMFIIDIVIVLVSVTLILAFS